MSKIKDFQNRVSDALHTFRGSGSVLSVETPTNIKEERRSGKSAADFGDRRQKYRSHQDVRTLESAISLAESSTYNREDLHQIYRQFVLEDPHVLSAWNNRKIKTIKRDFSFYQNGQPEPDEYLTELFKKSWFYDFIDKALESRAWGFSAIELFNWSKERERFEQYRIDRNGDVFSKELVPAVNLLNHDYIKPETGYIVSSPGISHEGGRDIFEMQDQVVFAGSREHGFLYRLAKPILFKSNALANWSEWIEVFGIDAIIVKTEATGKDRRDLLSALKNFGTSRVGVLNSEDEFGTVGSNKTDAYRVFEQMARYIDESTSKIIFGQDVVANNTGQVVGNVGENVANEYGEADARFIVNLVNDQLLPLMSRRGIIKGSGVEMRYNDKTSIREMKARAEVDLIISQMGFKHDVDQINERYSVNVETVGTAPISEVKNRLKLLYP